MNCICHHYLTLKSKTQYHFEKVNSKRQSRSKMEKGKQYVKYMKSNEYI